MGGRERRSRADLRRAMGPLAERGWRANQSNRWRHCRHKTKSAKPTFDRECLERRRARENGAAAVPCPFPVLRQRRRTELPALSAQRRSVSRRAVQHRFIRVAYDDGRAGLRFTTRGIHPHLRRFASLPEPPRAGSRTIISPVSSAPAHAIKSRGQKYRRVPLRGLHPQRIRSTSRDQSADRRLTRVLSRHLKPNEPKDNSMDRRRFLITSSMLAGGVTGATSLLVLDSRPASAASDEPEPAPNIIGPRRPYSPHVGTLVSMLNWMRRAILIPAQGLTVAQLDYLHDEKANTIGALLLHLAAIERFYQINTFEGKKCGNFDDATQKRLGAAALLD